MKVQYRGHAIEANRGKCLGGWDLLYFSVFRMFDGLECVSSFEDSAERVGDKIKQLKELVDDEMKQKKPWGSEIEYHNKCHDCGRFLKKELWVPKDHPRKAHALCRDCFSLYD